MCAMNFVTVLLRSYDFFYICLFVNIEIKTFGWHIQNLQSHVAQSISCPLTDASLTADTGVTSSILARSHIFVEVEHEIISMVSLLPSAESFYISQLIRFARASSYVCINC